MEHTLHLKLDFNLNLGGGISIDHRHHHSSNPSQPGAADILNSIQDLKGTFMTQLQDALAELKADDAQLEAEIDEVLGKLAQVPSEIAAAVQEALVNAGVDDATIRQAVIDIDTGVKAAIGKVTAVLNPPTDGGGDTTSGGDTSTDTLVGGQGDDTLGGGNGSDTVGAGGGTDTSVGGQGDG
jgi:Ca2+-binding RTX toxin-like protein